MSLSHGTSPRRHVAALVAAYLQILSAIGLAQEMANDPQPRLSVIATGEILGELEPCGCTPGQLGGLGRRHAYLKSQDRNGIRRILVDNGDLVKRCGRQAEIKLEILSMAMNTMGYSACNVGERDVLLGLAHLRQAQEAAQLPLVSANIVNGEREPVFAPYRLIPNGDGATDKIAIIGVISPGLQRDIEGNSDGLRIVDPLDVLRTLLPDLRTKCKQIVVLAHCPERESVTLARAFPDIALIISGHGRQDAVPPKRIGASIIAGTGQNGKSLIVCGLAGSSWSCSIVPLGADLPDTPEMTQLMDFYKEMVRSEGLLVACRSKPGKGQFAGSRACMDCHDRQYAFWRETKHATAYDSLKAKAYHYDPECVGCHTTGFGLVSGFHTPEKTRRMANVGCECCHGPCKLHIEEASKKVKSRWQPVSRESCMECHVYERSPGFDYERYLDKVRPPE